MTFETDFNDFLPPRSKQIVSMGYVMQMLNITPSQLRLLMEETSVRFSDVIDGIGYVTVADCETVCRKARDLVKAIADALDETSAAPNN